MEPLEYFSNEENLAQAIENPDKGIDLVFDLEPADWQALLGLWDSRNQAWREAIMYFAGLVDMEDTLPLLTKGLMEADVNVHVEAALSIADAVLDGDEFPLGDVVKNRLKEIAQSPIGKDFDELHDLLKALK